MSNFAFPAPLMTYAALIVSDHVQRGHMKAWLGTHREDKFCGGLEI
jgi:hypothetical protein